MAATTQTTSNLTPLQSALLNAKHDAATVSEAATIAYWLDGKGDVVRDQHINWLIEAYDRLAPQIAALRALTAKQAA